MPELRPVLSRTAGFVRRRGGAPGERAVELLKRVMAGGATPAAPVASPSPEQDHEAFVRRIYRELLEREPDEEGRTYILDKLRGGTSQVDVVLEIADSAEFIELVRAGRHLRNPGREDLPDLTELRPDQYALMPTPTFRRVLAFHVRTSADFDWLEDQLASYDYYEAPGVWSFERDADKVLMAELLAELQPRQSLELGCSTGAVMAGLLERGVDVHGVDLSKLALSHADPAVAPRITVGDVLDADLPDGNDLVYGLDLFEHLNPNRLGRYLNRIAELAAPGGFVFANIPAFGDDEVFGQLAPFHLQEWERPDAPQPYDWLHVDDRGWPLHGHLIWARATWWVEQFAGAGLRRRPDLERVLHARFDDRIDSTGPARKSFFVFDRPRD